MSLSLESIQKQVGQETHLYEMSLSLEPGLNVLLGPTLAGKTSLMRIMAGLDHPTEGRVLENDQDVSKTDVRKRNVAFVYQQFINYPSLNVFENIASPLRVKGGLSQADIKAKVQHVAEIMRIDNMLKRLPAELSGGQQQRTAIARALVKEADLLLMDEPLVNLDYKLREELRAEMRDIFARQNAVVIYATTEPLEALMLGGNTSVLDQGQLLQTGDTLEVYHHPDSQRVGEVFSDPPMNLISASVSNGEAQFSPTLSFALPEHMQKLREGKYQIGVRANHADLRHMSTQDITIHAQVELAEISGSETFVHIDGGLGFRVVAQLEGVHNYNLGQDVTLHLDPKRLFAFDEAGQLAAAPKQQSPIVKENA